MSTGDDVTVDLRKSNRKRPELEDFYEIVTGCVEDKTTINDRRYCSSDGGWTCYPKFWYD